jgi:hypothetical protein
VLVVVVVVDHVALTVEAEHGHTGHLDAAMHVSRCLPNAG